METGFILKTASLVTLKDGQIEHSRLRPLGSVIWCLWGFCFGKIGMFRSYRLFKIPLQRIYVTWVEVLSPLPAGSSIYSLECTGFVSLFLEEEHTRPTSVCSEN